MYLGRRHKLLSHFHWHSSSLWEGTPYHVINELNTHVLEEAKRFEHLESCLQEILDALEQNAVLAIPFKGPALASYYEYPSIREFLDLDILIESDHLPTVVETMVSLGYEPELSGVAGHDLRSYMESTYVYHFVRRSDPWEVFVEAHWSIAAQSFGFFFDSGIWNRAKAHQVGSSRRLALSHEDMLILVAVHGCRHAFSKLKWLVDIERISIKVDIDLTLEMARRQKAESMIVTAIRLADSFFPYRSGLLGRVDPGGLQNQRRFIEYIIFSGRRITVEETRLFHVHTKDSLVERLHYLFRITLLPKKRDIKAALDGGSQKAVSIVFGRIFRVLLTQHILSLWRFFVLLKACLRRKLPHRSTIFAESNDIPKHSL